MWIPDGHGLHINFKFLRYGEHNGIYAFCLPPRSTHLIQPLDIGLFSHLQANYYKAVEDNFLTTRVGTTRSLLFPLYKKARALTYTEENIKKTFKKVRIIPFNPRTVLGDLPPNRQGPTNPPSQPSSSTGPPTQSASFVSRPTKL